MSQNSQILKSQVLSKAQESRTGEIDFATFSFRWDLELRWDLERINRNAILFGGML